MLDINLPDISGIEVTHKLKAYNQNVKILLLTALTNELFPIKLLEAGALGYISKNTSYKEFLLAVKTVSQGNSYVDSAIAQKLVATKYSRKLGQFSNLSDRELEVMTMIVRGLDIKKIATKLHIRYTTVHSYRSRIFKKLQVKNNFELLVKALKNNIFKINEIKFE